MLEEDTQSKKLFGKKFIESLKSVKPDTDVPYVVGYKGFRTAVKAENVHGENFHNASLEGRNIAKMRHYS